MVDTQNDNIPPCGIYIDKEGHWYHKGMEIIRRELIALFYQNMAFDKRGRYIIRMNEERCYVDVADTAFVVWRASYVVEDETQNAKMILYLSDNTAEELEPQTLSVGHGNVLYCKVKNGTFPARFNRASYYQLAQHIEAEGDTHYYLCLKGRRYLIHTADAVVEDIRSD